MENEMSQIPRWKLRFLLYKHAGTATHMGSDKVKSKEKVKKLIDYFLENFTGEYTYTDRQYANRVPKATYIDELTSLARELPPYEQRHVLNTPSLFEELFGSLTSRFSIFKYTAKQQATIATISPMLFFNMLSYNSFKRAKKGKHPVSTKAFKIAMKAKPVFPKILHFNDLEAVQGNAPHYLIELRQLSKWAGKPLLGP